MSKADATQAAPATATPAVAKPTAPQPEAAPERTHHRLAVLADDHQSAIIHDAIRLQHAMNASAVRGKHTNESNGSALAAICAEWLDATTARLAGTKAGA